MSVPGWWDATLLALAAFRTWRLLATDTILDRVRDRIVGDRDRLAEFVECPWCFGWWITVAWWAAWQAWPHEALVAASLFAIAAASALLARLI